MKNIEDKIIINEKNPIYSELVKLSSFLSNNFSDKVENIINLIDFFNTLSLEFINFGKGIKFPTKLSKFSIFYELQISIIGKINKISNSIKNEIIDPLLIFKAKYENENKEILLNINEILEEINRHQNILNQIKQNYYNNSQRLNDNVLDEEEKNILENNYYNIYFTEYDKINRVLEESEKKYLKIKKKIIDNENEKNKIILNKINEYLNYINNEIKVFENNDGTLLDKLNKNQIDNKNIIKIIEDNTILNKKWIQEINLDSINVNFSKQNSYIINNNYSLKKKNYEIALNNFTNNNYFKYNNNYFSKIEELFSVLKSDKKIENYLLKEINEIIKNNKSNYHFYQIFISLFNESIKKTNSEKGYFSSLFIFKSFSNLVYLTNIINNILEDIKDSLLLKENHNLYYIFDQIILMGEFSVYENTFMCSLLNKNKIFQNIFVWKNSIFNKIVSILNDISNDVVEEETNIINKDLKKIIKLVLERNNIIYKNKKNIIELTGLKKYIKNYEDLSDKQKENINEKYSSEILHEVIKSYLKHMGNYNYILENPSDINDIILNDLNINNQDKIKFFIKYYSICINTTKKEKSNNIYFIKNKKTIQKISLIKNNKNEIINQKYPCNLSLKKSKYIILKNISKYLGENDNLKLLHISKEYKKINKVFYKNILKETNIPIKKRINIWKAYLECNTYSSVFNYNQLLLQINKQETIKENKNINDQIIKDLKRTKYKLKETPAALFELLRCFAFSNNKIGYFQGLNLISLFLFELTRNKEETFLIINNLICFTRFGELLENNFEKLKIFYYIIERLIYLYLPRIYAHFEDNQIKVIYFINPYFLTIFTNIYINLPDNELCFLLYVWDYFILNGWKSIFEIFLTIFKFIEKKILSLKGDEILTFLGNDLVKNDLFLDKNFKEFCELKKIFNINKELIDSIEQEFLIETKLNHKQV